MPFWQLYYHIVWSTRNREPLINDRIETRVHETIRRIAGENGFRLHAIGGMADHVHLVVEAPPSVKLSEAVGKIKGSSSHWINNQLLGPDDERFSWQGEYGVVSFAGSNLESVCHYVENQREHHQSSRIRSTLETDGTHSG